MLRQWSARLRLSGPPPRSSFSLRPHESARESASSRRKQSVGSIPTVHVKPPAWSAVQLDGNRLLLLAPLSYYASLILSAVIRPVGPWVDGAQIAAQIQV